MTRSAFRLTMFAGLIGIVVQSVSCASAPDTQSAPPVDAGHDPSLHAAHVHPAPAAGGDSVFAALQARGATAMGVDQYTSTHTFEPRPDGGRIALRRDVDDPAGAEQIRAHLRTIAAAFAAGDFTTPGFVHAGTVPGVDVMAARRASIAYQVAAIYRGGQLIMTSTDSLAIDAIHRFLAYQRSEHRAPGVGNLQPPPT